MRPKLRGDCLYFATDDGAYLETPDRSVLLSGPATYQLLDRVAPFLDGGHTLDSLAAALPPTHAAAVTALVETLAAGGLVRDADADLPHGLGPAVLDRYADEIALLDPAGSGAYRFERFRAGRVLVLGDGPLAAAVVAGLWRVGVRCPEAAVDPGTAERLAAALTAERHRDPDVDLITVAGPDLAAVRAGAPVPAGYDAVLHCADRPLLGRVVAVDRAGSAAGVPVLHVVVVDGSAWIGPLADRSNGRPADACFECGWLRLLGTFGVADPRWPAHQLADRPDAPAEPFLSGPLTDLIAVTAAFGYLRSATGCGLDGTDPRLVRIKLRSAESLEHPFRPHPHCGGHRAEPVWHDLPTPGPGPGGGCVEVGGEQLRSELDLLVMLDAGSHRQVPVHVVEAAAADLTAGGAGPVTVVAAGDTAPTARRRAAVLAAERAADRLLSGGPEPGHVVTAAAGDTWAEAVGRALLRRCHQRVLATGWAATAPVSALDGSAGDVPRAALLLEPGLAVAVTTWPGSGPPDAGFATVAVRTGGRVLAVASAVTVDAALRTALEATILCLQGVAAPVPDIDPDLGGPGWEPRVATLAAHLGGTVRVASAGIDPALTRIVAYLAAVATPGDVPAPRRLPC